MTIWKYQLEVTDQQEINIPDEAELLTVQIQNGVPCLWAKVNPKNLSTTKQILTFGTGNPFTGGLGLLYVGTYQLHEGKLVFHVFEQVY